MSFRISATPPRRLVIRQWMTGAKLYLAFWIGMALLTVVTCMQGVSNSDWGLVAFMAGTLLFLPILNYAYSSSLLVERHQIQIRRGFLRRSVRCDDVSAFRTIVGQVPGGQANLRPSLGSVKVQFGTAWVVSMHAEVRNAPSSSYGIFLLHCVDQQEAVSWQARLRAHLATMDQPQSD